MSPSPALDIDSTSAVCPGSTAIPMETPSAHQTDQPTLAGTLPEMERPLR
jgi:hypothetical protein